MATIGESLEAQFERAWEMLQATIERFEADQWRAGDAPGLVPARWACHIVEVADFYLQDQPDRSILGGRFGVKFYADAADFPDQEQLLTYLGEVRTAYRSKLVSLADEEYFGENAFEWTGSNVLERMLYCLRHTMTHQGELSMLLRLHGAVETEWR